MPRRLPLRRRQKLHSHAQELPEATPTARSDQVKGLLAGRVMDKYRRQIPEAEIEVVDLQETNLKKSAPLDVASDSQGYFTIQGLEVGHNYRLVARARDGAAILSGTTFAVATNSRVSIFVSEDFTTPDAKPPRKKALIQIRRTTPGLMERRLLRLLRTQDPPRRMRRKLGRRKASTSLPSPKASMASKKGGLALA